MQYDKWIPQTNLYINPIYIYRYFYLQSIYSMNDIKFVQNWKWIYVHVCVMIFYNLMVKLIMPRDDRKQSCSYIVKMIGHAIPIGFDTLRNVCSLRRNQDVCVQLLFRFRHETVNHVIETNLSALGNSYCIAINYKALILTQFLMVIFEGKWYRRHCQ